MECQEILPRNEMRDEITAYYFYQILSTNDVTKILRFSDPLPLYQAKLYVLLTPLHEVSKKTNTRYPYLHDAICEYLPWYFSLRKL